MTTTHKLPLALLLAISSTCLADTPQAPATPAPAAPAKPLGYQDTPIIPGTNWHVHDGLRPQPAVVTPGAQNNLPPSDAVVLFDGNNELPMWKPNKEGKPLWPVEEGNLVAGRGYLETAKEYGPDIQLHLEWTAPNPPKGDGQGRGNSGVFFFGGRYEIQILDNYENQTYPDGQATAVYGQTPPLVNACRKPGEWQTYDIIFTAPRFEGDTLKSPAYVTVIHNGVIVQNHTAFLGPTNHKSVPPYKPHGLTGTIKLQDHGNPVRFRNIWIREVKPVDSNVPANASSDKAAEAPKPAETK